ncbi:MAG: hypothetical protein ACQEV6_01455 [Pseudomonadota bacterium]
MFDKILSAVALFVFLVIDDSIIAGVEGAIDQPVLSAIAGGAADLTMMVMCFTYLAWWFGHTLRHAVRDLFRADSRWHYALNLGAALVLVAAYRFLEVAVIFPFVAETGTQAVIFTGMSVLFLGLTYASAKWIFRWVGQGNLALGLAIHQAEAMGASEKDIIEALRDSDPLSWKNIFKRLSQIRPKRSFSAGKAAPEEVTKTQVQDSEPVGAPDECKPSKVNWVFGKVLIATAGVPMLYVLSTCSGLGKAAFSAGDYSAMAVYFGVALILALPVAFLVAKFFGVPISEFYKSKGTSEMADAVSTMFD